MALLRKRPLLFLLFVTLLLPFVVLRGDERVYVYCENQTQYYLHIIINGEPFLYVAPQRAVNVNVDGGGKHVALMEAFYSPGQGITGSASRGVEISYVVDCGSGSACSEPTSSNATNPVLWIITPDLLQGGSSK